MNAACWYIFAMILQRPPPPGLGPKHLLRQGRYSMVVLLLKITAVGHQAVSLSGPTRNPKKIHGGFAYTQERGVLKWCKHSVPNVHLWHPDDASPWKVDLFPSRSAARGQVWAKQMISLCTVPSNITRPLSQQCGTSLLTHCFLWPLA